MDFVILPTFENLYKVSHNYPPPTTPHLPTPTNTLTFERLKQVVKRDLAHEVRVI